MTHQELTAELSAQLAEHPDRPLVIEDEDGRQYEIVDCSMENVGDADQVLLVISRTNVGRRR